MYLKNWSFAFKRYGPEWRDHRREFHQLLNQGKIYQYHPVIEQVTLAFLRRLAASPTEFLEHTRFLFGTIIMRVAYGAEDDEYNRELIDTAETFLRTWTEYSQPGRLLVSAFPKLRYVPSWFPGAGWKRELETLGSFGRDMIQKAYDDVKAQVKNNNVQPGFTNMARSLVDSLPEESSPDYAYRDRVSRNVAAVSYIAGSDTTLSSATSLFIALATHPEVQKRAQAEIDSSTGGVRLPTCNDIKELPYVQAIVKETGRWHTAMPFGLPHMSQEDDVYDGRFIPAGTWILPNTWSVMHNPEIFEDPMEFKPERYLKNGKIDPSVLDPESGAFGYGRRICPGRHLSNEGLGLMVASLLAVFDIQPPKDEYGNPIPLKLEIESRVLITPKPFKCDIIPRSERHAALLQA